MNPTPIEAQASCASVLPTTSPLLATPQLDGDDQGPGPKPVAKARWSRQRAQRPDQPCYLYLFVHQQEPRFKIGLSIEPFNRLAQLKEAPKIDLARSMVVRLDSVKRAYEIEGMLHKALSPHRIHPGRRARHGGDTEWFELSSLALATQLILDTPSSAQAVGFLLEPLSHHAATLASPSRSGTDTSASVPLLALNLKAAQTVSQMLMQVAQEVHIDVMGSEGKSKTQPTLILRDFRHFGTQSHLPRQRRQNGHLLSEHQRHQLRMKVFDLESYQLAGRRSCAKTQTWLPPDSLVRSISYGAGKAIGELVAGPDDLLIRFASAHALHPLPGGEQLSKAVDVLASQLTLMTLMNQRAQAHERAWYASRQPTDSASFEPDQVISHSLTSAH